MIIFHLLDDDFLMINFDFDQFVVQNNVNINILIKF